MSSAGVPKGVLPVLATPFLPDGKVDEESFVSLIQFTLHCGVDGLVFPGMASEVGELAAAERSQLVRRLGRTLKGKQPFVVGASAPDPETVIARMREGQAAGAVAAMIMAPPAIGSETEAVAAFFEKVGAGNDLPIILQNAPPPFGAGMSAQTIAAIVQQVPAIAYVKEETLPSGHPISALLGACENIDGVIGGGGARAAMDELIRGAHAIMPASELCDAHSRLISCWRAGDVGGARATFYRTLPLLQFQQVFRMAMSKHVLRRRGIIAHDGVRAAGPRLDKRDREELDQLLADHSDLFSHNPPKAA